MRVQASRQCRTGLVLVICVGAMTGTVRSQETEAPPDPRWTTRQSSDPGDPRESARSQQTANRLSAAVNQPVSRWERLRKAVWPFRAKRQTAGEGGAPRDRSAGPGAVAAGPGNSTPAWQVADPLPNSSQAAGQRRQFDGIGWADDPGPAPTAPAAVSAGATSDLAAAPAAFVMMQGAGAQNTPTPGLSPESIPSEEEQPQAGTAAPGSPVVRRSFGQRLLRAYFAREEEEAEAESTEQGIQNRRINLPPPFAPSPPFPFAEHTGPNIGVNDTSVYPLMDALYRGPNGDHWKKSRIKIFGWVDPSYNASTSRNSNVPMSYDIVPNQLELSQAILIFERPLDTVQTDHFDWGFRFTNLYGIDYRYTTAKGYFSDQLLKHNHLYGYDPLQMYLDLYCPKV